MAKQQSLGVLLIFLALEASMASVQVASVGNGISSAASLALPSTPIAADQSTVLPPLASVNPDSNAVNPSASQGIQPSEGTPDASSVVATIPSSRHASLPTLASLLSRVLAHSGTSGNRRSASNLLRSLTHMTQQDVRTVNSTDACFPGEIRGVDNTTCQQCDPGFYAPEGASTCLLCGRKSVATQPGQSECQECDINEVADSDHINCISRDDEAGIATWVIEGYAGLMMTVSLLDSLDDVVYMTNSDTPFHPDSPYFGWELPVCIAVVIFVVISLSFASVYWTQESEISWIFVTTSIIYLITKMVCMGLTKKLPTMKNVRDDHALFFDWFSLLSVMFIVFRCSYGKTSYRRLRRVDILLVMTLELLIQIHVASFADSFAPDHAQMNKHLMMVMIGLMVFHSISFPASLVLRVRKYPTDVAITPSELTNLHFIGDYYGTITSGLSIVTLMVEKASQASESANENVRRYRKIARRANVLATTFPCPVEIHSADPGTKVAWEVHAHSATTELNDLVDQLDEEFVCDLAKSGGDEWSIVDIPHECGHHIASVDSWTPQTRLCAPAKLARSLATALQLQAQKTFPSLEFSKRYALMSLLAAGYYGAVYNIIDMANSMTADLDLDIAVYVISGTLALMALTYLIPFYNSHRKNRLEDLIPTVTECVAATSPNNCPVDSEYVPRCFFLNERTPCSQCAPGYESKGGSSKCTLKLVSQSAGWLTDKINKFKERFGKHTSRDEETETESETEHKPVTEAAHKPVNEAAHKTVTAAEHKTVTEAAHKTVTAAEHKTVTAAEHKTTRAESARKKENR